MGFMARSAIPIPIALHAWLHRSPDTASRTDAQQGRSRPTANPSSSRCSTSRRTTPSLGAPGAPRGAYRENAAVRDAKPVKSSGVGGRAAVGLLAGPARAARARRPGRLKNYILITLLETKPAAVRGFRCGALERARLLKPYHTSTTSRPILLHSRLIHDACPP